MRLAVIAGLLAAASMTMAAGSATAGCAFGVQNRAGSIGPGQEDPSRSFTVAGSATLTVSSAAYSNGVPAPLVVSFPGYCGPQVGATVSCRVTPGDTREVNAIIVNNGPDQVTYRWLCNH